jgi:hypothetical protein
MKEPIINAMTAPTNGVTNLMNLINQIKATKKQITLMIQIMEINN